MNEDEDNWWVYLSELIAECVDQYLDLGKALLDAPAGHWGQAYAAGLSAQEAVEELADRFERERKQIPPAADVHAP
jgi:hypothetical protein